MFTAHFCINKIEKLFDNFFKNTKNYEIQCKDKNINI